MVSTYLFTVIGKKPMATLPDSPLQYVYLLLSNIECESLLNENDKRKIPRHGKIVEKCAAYDGTKYMFAFCSSLQHCSRLGRARAPPSNRCNRILRWIPTHHTYRYGIKRAIVDSIISCYYYTVQAAADFRAACS